MVTCGSPVLDCRFQGVLLHDLWTSATGTGFWDVATATWLLTVPGAARTSASSSGALGAAAQHVEVAVRGLGRTWPLSH